MKGKTTNREERGQEGTRENFRGVIMCIVQQAHK